MAILGTAPFGAAVRAADLPVMTYEGSAFPAIDALVQKMLAENNGSAGQLTITREGRVIYDKAFGYRVRDKQVPMDGKVLMRVGSVTKPLTAAVIRALVEKKRINLSDRPFQSWSDRGMLKQVRPELKGITVDMLLQHRGGWNRAATFDPAFGLPPDLLQGKRFSDLTGAQLVDLMSVRIPDFIPGTQECYSNFGYIVLGRVIEDATGSDYGKHLAKFMRDEIGNGDFAIGTASSRYVPGSPECEYNDLDCNLRVMDAAAGCVTNTRALCRFLSRFLVSGARYTGGVWTYTFFGSIPGSCSFVRQRLDKINYAYLQNGRTGAMEPYVATLDQILDGLAQRK